MKRYPTSRMKTYRYRRNAERRAKDRVMSHPEMVMAIVAVDGRFAAVRADHVAWYGLTEQDVLTRIGGR